MNLSDYRTLGRSGLAVSPLALGTMTFANKGWGSDDTVSEAIFNAYVDAGGNFLDTADVYAGGRSETLLGGFVARRGLRDRVVLATKFGFGTEDGNPHAGGNGRKQIYRALEGSLKRLGTDYVDLYWMHVWDALTPVEEVLQTLGDLQRAGKIRYFGFSDLPAWYAAKAAALAGAYAMPGPIALQMEYSLVARDIENEHLPAARDAGLGVCPWSPLAGGFLTGKYGRGDSATAGTGAVGAGRLSGSNPFQGPYSKFTDRNWAVLEALQSVAQEAALPPACVALAWVLGRPGVASPILGAARLEQLTGNLAALDVALTPAQTARLDAAGTQGANIYSLFTPEGRESIFGVSIRGWE